MARKKNQSKGKQPNTHKAAVAICYECEQKLYMVLDVRAQVIAVISEDKHGSWTNMHEQGYGDLPIYGPVEVSSGIIEELEASGRRELNALGPILAGTIGAPVTTYLDGDWAAGKAAATAYNPVEVKGKHGRSQPYGGELRATMGELAQLKSRLLRKK